MNQERRFSFFEFFQQIFIIFGVQVMFTLFVICIFPVDEFLPEFSALPILIELGSQGISTSALLQFIISSLGIAALVTVFTTDVVFKKMLLLWRSVIMFTGIIMYMSFLIIVFDWFPMDSLGGWISFFITFMLFFILSISVMMLKTHYENKKYAKILKEFKERNGGMNDE